MMLTVGGIEGQKEIMEAPLFFSLLTQRSLPTFLASCAETFLSAKEGCARGETF